MRRDVLKYLADIYPQGSSASEIARRISRGVNDVYGALHGVSNRYKKECSLVALGLVAKEKQGAVNYYTATELGCRSCRQLIR